MITKEQLKDEINAVEDPQILELVYQLLLKIKQGNISQKMTLSNWLLENMQGLGNLNLPDRKETDREIPFQQ
ncbi:MAG: hypothetical protein NT008_04115 [Methylococcales bacterium]|jgi:hypothetical protein|nr:hypothetical protein [Methylococcales bacterium]